MPQAGRGPCTRRTAGGSSWTGPRQRTTRSGRPPLSRLTVHTCHVPGSLLGVFPYGPWRPNVQSAEKDDVIGPMLVAAARQRGTEMQVEELLKPFPIKEFHPFPRAMLGPGAWELLGPEAKTLGFSRVLVMTSGLRGSDTVAKIVGSLRYHGLEVVVYDKVESNPKDYNVMDAVALYQENKCDSFISIGGGSSHDACKGARISVAHDGRSVNEFEGFNKSE